MTGGDLLGDAVAQLYSSDPDNFVERRGALAAQARAAGQAPVARKIAALRKPTRSAWVVNQLVRAAPDATAELASLGDELRAAQKSLDGEAIRDLSLRRRQLIDALTRQAFLVSGQDAPTAALRDEVAATLGAALADPEVAEQLAEGTLERAAHSEGFGPPGPPALTLVTSSGTRRRQPARTARSAPVIGSAKPADTPQPRQRPGRAEHAAKTRVSTTARPASRATVVTAGQPGADQERRQAIISAAEEALASASQLADAATATEQEQERSVQHLQEQLADARQRLATARVQARRARARQRQARQALDRLQQGSGSRND